MNRDVHIALLRGINVGGRHKLPMKVLADVFAELGCREVRTYIQSGNVVFRAPTALARRVPQAVARAVAHRTGLDVPVIVRSRTGLQRALERSPFAARGEDTGKLHVAFLAGKPAAARVRALDQDRSPPDELAVVGGEVHLFLPNGVGRTRITNAWLDAALGTVSTLRNWRTCQRLLAMASSGADLA